MFGSVTCNSNLNIELGMNTEETKVIEQKVCVMSLENEK